MTSVWRHQEGAAGESNLFSLTNSAALHILGLRIFSELLLFCASSHSCALALACVSQRPTMAIVLPRSGTAHTQSLEMAFLFLYTRSSSFPCATFNALRPLNSAVCLLTSQRQLPIVCVPQSEARAGSPSPVENSRVCPTCPVHWRMRITKKLHS